MDGSLGNNAFGRAVQSIVNLSTLRVSEACRSHRRDVDGNVVGKAMCNKTESNREAKRRRCAEEGQLYRDLVVLNALEVTTPHTLPHTADELFAIPGHLLRGILVQGIVRVGLEEEVLQSDHDGV